MSVFSDPVAQAMAAARYEIEQEKGVNYVLRPEDWQRIREAATEAIGGMVSGLGDVEQDMQDAVDTPEPVPVKMDIEPIEGTEVFTAVWATDGDAECYSGEDAWPSAGDEDSNDGEAFYTDDDLPAADDEAIEAELRKLLAHTSERLSKHLAKTGQFDPSFDARLPEEGFEELVAQPAEGNFPRPNTMEREGYAQSSEMSAPEMSGVTLIVPDSPTPTTTGDDCCADACYNYDSGTLIIPESLYVDGPGNDFGALFDDHVWNSMSQTLSSIEPLDISALVPNVQISCNVDHGGQPCPWEGNDSECPYPQNELVPKPNCGCFDDLDLCLAGISCYEHYSPWTSREYMCGDYEEGCEWCDPAFFDQESYNTTAEGITLMSSRKPAKITVDDALGVLERAGADRDAIHHVRQQMLDEGLASSEADYSIKLKDIPGPDGPQVAFVCDRMAFIYNPDDPQGEFVTVGLQLNSLTDRSNLIGLNNAIAKILDQHRIWE